MIFSVYIMANRWHTTFYVGVTSNLQKRVTDHKSGQVEGFTRRYNVTELLYFEEYSDVKTAISREKQLKGYRREKKLALINSMNPELKDLAHEHE